jgi:hypothetical protein
MAILVPAEQIKWRRVESSNVRAVGWDQHRNMYIQFKSGTIYQYPNVSRQRAVAVSTRPSVGTFVNRRIIPNFHAIRLEGPHSE